MTHLPILRRTALILALMIGVLDLTITGILVVHDHKRQNETCTLFTGRWQTDVRQVRTTRQFVRDPATARSPLGHLAEAQLPGLIRRTRAETPPKFCGVSDAEKRHAEQVLDG